MESRKEELLSRLEILEAGLSEKADAWTKQFMLGLGAANGLGLASQVGLLQAADDASSAAGKLIFPALLFLGGLAISAAASFAAGRSAAALSRAYFEQRQAITLSDDLKESMMIVAVKWKRSSKALDRLMQALTWVALGCFAAGTIWTFTAVAHGALS